MKNTNRKKIWLAVWCLFLAACICFNVWATNYALSWDKALSDYFGYIGGTENTSEKYSSVDELREAERALALQIVDEGAVLLKNDNGALPLTAGSKVSVFGQTAQMWMTKEKLSNTKDTVFLESLQEAGLEVNNELRKMYKQSKHTKWGTGANLGDGGIAGTWAVDEVPVSEFSDAAKQSYVNFPDAAIVVFTRGGSEGGDLPRDMERFGGEAGKGYLELMQTERDLLTEVTENFEKVIVILAILRGNVLKRCLPKRLKRFVYP